ncbi:MAG: ATP-dependent Clp protease ATP-binding subunit ClpX [Myxococcales bacterium]|nr:ATP-dependent Clp protease ATP-binding subunit ClpX [Myxococcales bacterium]
MSDKKDDDGVRCSFCGKDAKDFRKLIQGNQVHICDECVRLCKEIIDEDSPNDRIEAESLGKMQPATIKSYLDEHIIGQNLPKKTLAVAVYNHYKRMRADEFEDEEEDEGVELSKGNILLIGPSGCGKTLMAQTLAKRLDVPFTMADATSLTEAGYVGEDVDSVIKNLWIAAERDVERAGQGIVCLDEIDKVARRGDSPSATRDVGGEGVQQALLKMIESQKVMIPPEGSRNRPQQEFIQVDTRGILFVLCGSFEGLDEIIRRRIGKSGIGFGAEAKKTDMTKSQLLRLVQPEDLIKYGLIPEFVGRIPVIVPFDELTEEDLLEILWKPKNALVRQYRRLFELDGVKLRFHDEAMVAIVREAIRRNTGARGLRAIIEEVMLDIMYDLPSQDDVRECIITEDVIVKGTQPLLVYEKRESA